jgi:hypothetical protein
MPGEWWGQELRGVLDVNDAPVCGLARWCGGMQDERPKGEDGPALGPGSSTRELN